MTDKKRVITPKFQVAFAKVWEPDEETEKYKLCMVFDVSEDLAAMKALASETFAEYAGAKAKPSRKVFKSGDAYVDSKLEDAEDDQERKEIEEKYGNFRGKVMVNAASKFAPGILGPDKQDILDKKDFYNGCFARAAITAYGWEYQGKKGVSFNLNNLIKVGDGERFGGAVAATDDFAEIEVAPVEADDIEIDL